MSGWDSSGFACLLTVFCLQARSKEFALVMLSPGRSLTYRLLGPAVPCFDVFADMWHVLGFGGLIGFVKQAEASLATGTDNLKPQTPPPFNLRRPDPSSNPLHVPHAEPRVQVDHAMECVLLGPGSTSTSSREAQSAVATARQKAGWSKSRSSSS